LVCKRVDRKENVEKRRQCRAPHHSIVGGENPGEPKRKKKMKGGLHGPIKPKGRGKVGPNRGVGWGKLSRQLG